MGALEESSPKSVTFAEAKDEEQLLYLLAGAASTCWEHLDKAGIFESDQAKVFCEDALLRLRELRTPKMLDGLIDIGPECFTNGLVISYKGENYYMACNALVYEKPEGGASYCVKRVGHPGNIHEDYDGNTRNDP